MFPDNIEIEKLVKKAQSGDEDSFNELYEFFFEAIFHYVSFRVSGESVEDLVGEVFLKVVKNLKNYKPQKKASFKSWVYKIAYHQVIDFYRKQKELLGLEEDEEFFARIPDEKNLKPNESLQDSENQKMIQKVLKKLSPLHRTIIELKFLSELSNSEIAEITGKTEGNIRIIQLRALREMRQLFPEDF